MMFIMARKLPAGLLLRSFEISGQIQTRGIGVWMHLKALPAEDATILGKVAAVLRRL